MRICIPIEFRPQGGGFYFLQGFAEYLQAKGNFVTNDVNEAADALFTNHWMTPISEIYEAIRRNPQLRIIQRIDGAAQNYGRNAEADVRQSQVNQVADLTIFQSQYSRFSTREKYPIIHQDGPIVYNPVDLATFRPGKSLDPRKVRVACVTWSTNPYKGIAEIHHVIQQNQDIEFILCGNFAEISEMKNVERLGQLARQELADALRSCHLLLTFSRNEACPNHVLEALATGLPVLYSPSGAMAEVVGDCGEAVEVASFRRGLDLLMNELPTKSAAARRRAEELFNPEINFARYVDEIKKALAQPTRVPQWRRSTRAWFELLPFRKGFYA
jgi:glycosyltransferase involved in cell wall biosynthesis